MVTVNGGPVGPDGLGGSYKNTDSDDRALLWQSLGAQQGFLTGGEVAIVAGSLAVTVDPFRAAVAERDSAGNLLDRGYHAWEDDQVTIVFDPPSAQTRNDAVVLLVADTAAGEGAFGTDVTEAGPQVIPITGTSGVTTPVTDADIQAAVGAGGWVRVGDAVVNPGDTEIGAGNWTPARIAARPYTSVTASSPQTMSTAVETAMVFDTILEDNAGMFAAASPDRLTAQKDGLYQVSGAWSFDAGAAIGNRIVVIRINNGGAAWQWRPNVLDAPSSGVFNLPVRLNAGDFVQLRQYESSGGDLNTFNQPWPALALRWVSQ